VTPTPRLFADEITNLLNYLAEADLAISTSSVARAKGLVTWHRRLDAGEFLPQRRHPTIETYRAWVANSDYSAMLFDGALLQITYEFSDYGLVRHRLAYVPCPFDVDPELWRTSPFLDVIDLYAEGAAKDVVLRATLRFDFDTEAAAKGHPAAHFTINATSCRVGCIAPMRLGQFANFVFRHFYPELWQAHPFFSRMSQAPAGARSLTFEEAQSAHIAWALKSVSSME